MIQAKEALWYDEFYRQYQKEMPPWYRHVIPDLRRQLAPQSRLIDFGCGQGHILRYLAREKLVDEDRIYGIDQSRTAIDFVKSQLPHAHLEVKDIYYLDYPAAHFNVCLLMETIEHLEEPLPALENIHRVTAPNGLLYLSFPNYLHLPWLLVRILAEKLNHPNWIVLQPIDKIYFVLGLIRLVEKVGFKLETGIGSVYGPPVFYQWETDGMTRALNALRLWPLAFHPILRFRKPA